MGCHFNILRKKLDDLGYTQPLSIECVPLVNKLLSDLTTTTENLQKYMTISKNALDELSNIKLCPKPHKCDNIKLIEECNDLHLAFIHFKEQHEKLQKDLRTQNTILGDRLAECEAEKENLKQKVNGLKAELRANLGNSKRVSQFSLKKPIKELKENNTMPSADQKYCTLQKEMRKLREDQLELIKNNELLKSQLENRNQEIQRLSRLLEGGRPANRPTGDCENIDKKMAALQDEICALKADRNILDTQLKDINKLKQEKLSIQADLDALKLEKRHLQGALQSETEDKKALTDRINNLTIIEHDLNMEIDRLVRIQRRYEELLKKIEERNQTILDLHKEIKTLSDGKYKVSSTLASQRDSFENGDNCQKACCKRKQRELQLYRDEVKQLQRENDSLKNKIQELNQSTIFDQERMKKAFQDMEEHIRNLEDERRNMVVNQLTSRSNMTQLEEDCHMLKDKLRASQNELNTLKASYEQLKNLHEQSNLALMESRRQLAGSERELQTVQSKISLTHRETVGQEREISRLQNDIDIMKKQLTKLDKEKDDLLNALDEKTEKIESLEGQLTEKKNVISTLESEMKTLKQKFSKLSEEKFGCETQLKGSKHELNALQKDYDRILQARDAALQENRRLQDDLAIALADCKDARKELDLSTRQIDDLKRQLQHYVAEVKRFEDQISQKELERAEILDQFRSLSAEATNLETTNHTLENEAAQSKVQLSVALDHASDLERKLDNKDAIIRSYEKQSQYERIEHELRQMKDLCVQLDTEKDELRIELQNREGHKGVAQRNIERLSKDNEDLKKALRKDRNSVEDLEKLLDEARQEVIQQKLINQDLQTELTRMKARLEEVQERLIIPGDPNLPPNITQEPHPAVGANDRQFPETARLVSPQIALEQSQSVQCQTDFHENQESQTRRRELLNIQISDFGNVSDRVQTTLIQPQGTLYGQGARTDTVRSKEIAIVPESVGCPSTLKEKYNRKQDFKSKSTVSNSTQSSKVDAGKRKDINLTPAKAMIHGPAQSSPSYCSENTRQTATNEVEVANKTMKAHSTKPSDDDSSKIQKTSKEQEDATLSNIYRNNKCCKCAKCYCCQFCVGKSLEKESFVKLKDSKKQNCQTPKEHNKNKFISDTFTNEPDQGSSKKCSGHKSKSFRKTDKDSDSSDELHLNKENRPCDPDIYKISIFKTGKNVPFKYLNVKPLVISNVKSPSFPSDTFTRTDDGENIAQTETNCESSTTNTLVIEGPDMSCCISSRRMYCVAK
nr:unnamed protein product [Callosobruchus analis]